MISYKPYRIKPVNISTGDGRNDASFMPMVNSGVFTLFVRKMMTLNTVITITDKINSIYNSSFTGDLPGQNMADNRRLVITRRYTTTS